jgi:hypothetical protein
MLTASGVKLLDFGLAKPATMLGTQSLSEKGQLTPSPPTINLSALSPAAGYAYAARHELLNP